MFSWYYIEGILIQSCYTLLIVLGLSILTGYTGMFSFGHAGFVCIGAYVSILCTMAFGLPYWLSLIIAGLAAMLLGTVLLCALPELLRAVGDWRLVMYGLAVIVIMIVRPKGLMGGKELPVGRICRAVGRVFTKKKKDLPPPDGGSVGEEASV